jgi:hypothetical protein
MKDFVDDHWSSSDEESTEHMKKKKKKTKERSMKKQKTKEGQDDDDDQGSVKEQKTEEEQYDDDDEGSIKDNSINSGVDDKDYKIDGSVAGVDDDEVFNEEQELLVCNVCGGTPCEWLQYKAEVVEYATNSHFFVNHTRQDDPFSYPTEQFATMTEDEKEEVKLSHQEYKKSCFRFYTTCKYGKLGVGNRIKLGNCVENAIRLMFPNHDNSSVGYHSS